VCQWDRLSPARELGPGSLVAALTGISSRDLTPEKIVHTEEVREEPVP